MHEWTSPIYVFFHATPQIKYFNSCWTHVFECTARNCKAQNGRDVHCFLDKGDRKSMSNLHKHAKICWGGDTVEAANGTWDVEAACEILKKMKLCDGSIKAEFDCIGKGKVWFSTQQHTKKETQ